MNKKNDLKILLLFTIIILSIIFLVINSNYLFGSKTDWLTQHIVFPDYFRKLFYATGNLFPNYALNIGGGQNIYYFSYYGLLSPYILLSYLFPFIEMVNYLIIINIGIVIISGVLFYRWLCNNKYDNKIVLITSIIFMLISPLLFQAHKQIMLVNYMPFLILGLIGIDKYFSDNKKTLLIISTFLIIMTSYYFSVGSILTFIIYGIYKYIESKKFSFKSFFATGFKFLIPIFIGILMAFILLAPTALTVLSRDTGGSTNVNLISLLIPKDTRFLLYNTYGLGFTSIALIALIYNLFKLKKEKLFLSIILIIIMTIPIFTYILNGLLYIRCKALIPLSPLVGLVIAIFFTNIKEKPLDKKILYFIIFISLIILPFINNQYQYLYYIDLIITVIALILCKKEKVAYAIIIFISLFVSIANNKKTDIYVDKESYNKLFGSKTQALIDNTINKDNSFYRFSNLMPNSFQAINKIYNLEYYQTSIYSSTYNASYDVLHDNVNAIPYRNDLIDGESNSIMFQTLMGVKYIISNSNVPIGYELINGDEELGIYENDDVFPLGYISHSLMSESDYNKLQYPFNLEALLNNVVVSKKVDNNFISNIKSSTLSYESLVDKTVNIENKDNKLIIDTTDVSNIKLKLDNPIKDKILLVSLNLLNVSSCKEGDLAITINGVKNKLTCKEWLYFNNNYNFKYAISSPQDISEINIKLSKGHFEINDINIYTLDYDKIKSLASKMDTFVIDTKKTVDNKIIGNIKVNSDGYFTTTIPYDKGYTVLVNGKQQQYEKVNETFIGFPLKKGNYKIEMTYISPGFNVGVLGSTMGFIIFLVIAVIEKRKKELK